LVAFKVVFVLGPKAQTKFFRSSDSILNFGDAVKVMIGSIVGNGYDDEDWVKISNSIITKAFMKSERAPAYTRIADDQCQKAFTRWQSLPKIDLFKEVSNLVLMINFRAMLGERFTNAHADSLIPIYQQLEADLADPLSRSLPSFVPIPSRNRLRKTRALICHFVDQEIETRIAEMESGKEMPDDYLQFLLSSKDAGLRFRAVYPIHILLLVMAAHTNTGKLLD